MKHQWVVTGATVTVVVAALGGIALGTAGTPARAGVTSATGTDLTPNGLAVDSAGDVYIADFAHHVIDEVAPTGDLSVVAGITGRVGQPTPGPATASTLDNPSGLAVDGNDDLYIADSGMNSVVEKVDHATGTLSIVAGEVGKFLPPRPGPATSSDLLAPSGLAVDGTDSLYIADTFHAVVEKVDRGTGELSIVAGVPAVFDAAIPGPATASYLYNASGVAVAADGDLYIADTGNALIEMIDHAPGVLSIVAGTRGYSGAPTAGAATDSELGAPTGIAIGPDGSLYIADPVNDVVEEVDTSGMLSILAGVPGHSGPPTAGPAVDSDLNGPSEVAVDADGDLYVADAGNNLVEKITPQGVLSVFAGTGVGPAPSQPQLLPQQLSFSSQPPAAPVVGQTYVLKAAAGATGNPVSFAIDGSTSEDACSLAADGVTVRFDHAGNCVVDADQAGDGTYAAARAQQQIVVGKAASRTSVSVTPGTVVARVVSRNASITQPTGSVRFVVAGTTIGSTVLADGRAVLRHAITPTQRGHVSAVYAGDADFTGSSASTALENPTITARETSSARRTRSGWYAAPVTVHFNCRTHGAALTAPCPHSVRLARNGRAQSVTRTIVATDGGVATVRVSGINIDRTPPQVRVRVVPIVGGAHLPPRLVCVGRDALSGIARCRVTRRRIGHTASYRIVVRATDRAGNVRVRRGVLLGDLRIRWRR